MSEELTKEEEKALAAWVGAQTPEEKHSVHSFLFRVATADDTTKVGNLTTEELGNTNLSMRAYQELSLISDTILANDYFKDYYKKMSEIVTSSSLSKDAKLINLSVIQKREIADVTKKPKENKGWFKKKEPTDNMGGI